MVDVFNKAKRSEVMARIHATGNKTTELALMKLLRKHVIRGWRRKQAVYGRPDFVFRRASVAVFVDGCFWHGCPEHCKYPASNRALWRRKLDANKERDVRVTSVLKQGGWTVIRIRECELQESPSACIVRIRRNLRSGAPAA